MKFVIQTDETGNYPRRSKEGGTDTGDGSGTLFSEVIWFRVFTTTDASG